VVLYHMPFAYAIEHRYVVQWFCNSCSTTIVCQQPASIMNLAHEKHGWLKWSENTPEMPG